MRGMKKQLWLPPAKKPVGLEFSLHRDGWAKWYRGQSRVIAIKSVNRREIREAWDLKRAEIDAAIDKVVVRAAGAWTIREAAAHYYDYLDHRVSTGAPEPMSKFTAADYKRSINSFGRAIGPDRQIADLVQEDFTAYAKTLAANAPSTLFRVVSYVRAFFAYCVDEGLMAAMPQFGRFFSKPASQNRRDVRLSHQKSFTPDQIRMIFGATDRPDELAWIVAGTCGAFDNGDIANLTNDVIDRETGVVDYRRRKRGLVQRVIPMPPLFWALLDRYERPKPVHHADSKFVFLTPTGLPLQRLNGDAGRENTIDYIAMRFVRILIKAGLREKMPRRRDRAFRDLPRRTKAKGKAGGQGYRGLRTSFPNLAPPGYRDEIEIVMGHARASVLVENYLERFGLKRLHELVDSIYVDVFTWPVRQGACLRASASADVASAA